MRLVWIASLLFSLPALGQDAAQQAAQLQQTLQVQQQTQQALQQSQAAANQAAQQSLQTGVVPARAPRLKQQPDPQTGQVEVWMKSQTRGASLYYTIDGWTPTLNSTRYTGPVMLDRSTVLRVVAIAPGYLRSAVVVAPLVVPGSAAVLPAPAAVRVPQLDPGIGLPLLFTASVSSAGLQTGDRLPIALAADLYVNGALTAPRLTPVLATVTQADTRARQGLPGSISFAVHSLMLQDGTVLPLAGTETLEGESPSNVVKVSFVIPVVPFLVRGREASIPPGAMLTATVSGPPQRPQAGR